MKAIISVVGNDTEGLIAKISSVCADNKVNILDVNQTVMGEFFTMLMLVDMAKLGIGFDEFKEQVKEVVPTMKVHIMHEDIFRSMHEI